MVKFYSNESTLPIGAEVIRDNVKYFCEHTVHLLDENVGRLLRNTDQCEFLDKNRFKDKFGYDLPWWCLSTGGMTILNGYYNPDKIFTGIESGPNAMKDMGLLDRGQFFSAFPWGDSDTKYDVEIDGTHYTSFKEAFENA